MVDQLVEDMACVYTRTIDTAVGVVLVLAFPTLVILECLETARSHVASPSYEKCWILLVLRGCYVLSW